MKGYIARKSNHWYVAVPPRHRRDQHRRRMAWTASELSSFLPTIVCVNGRMQPSNGKTANAARTIDLADRTVAVLARWRQDDADRFGGNDPERGLIVRDDGELVNPQTLSQAFDRAAAKARLPQACTGCATRTPPGLKAGVPLKVVFERLGHSTPAFTMVTYQHVLPGMQAEAAATVANLLDGAGE